MQEKVNISPILREWLVKNWGRRCKKFEPECGLCAAWKCFDYLTNPDKFDSPIEIGIREGRKSQECCICGKYAECNEVSIGGGVHFKCCSRECLIKLFNYHDKLREEEKAKWEKKLKGLVDGVEKFIKANYEPPNQKLFKSYAGKQGFKSGWYNAMGCFKDQVLSLIKKAVK